MQVSEKSYFISIFVLCNRNGQCLNQLLNSVLSTCLRAVTCAFENVSISSLCLYSILPDRVLCRDSRQPIAAIRDINNCSYPSLSGKINANSRGNRCESNCQPLLPRAAQVSFHHRVRSGCTFLIRKSDGGTHQHTRCIP